MFDVLVVGAGVSGAFIARELTKYNLKTAVIEKEADVAMGTSKANSAIVHAGYDAEPGTNKAIFNVLGNKLMEKVTDELDVPFKRIGSYVIAFSDEESAELQKLLDKGIKNNVPDMKILDREEIRKSEPGISENVTAALYAPTAGIVCPYELTVGAIENAVSNGAELFLETEVISITSKKGYFNIETNKGDFQSKYVVNAAGVYADKVALMVGDSTYTIKPRKGEYLLLDKSQGNLLKKVIFQVPSSKGKGILVTPTVDGNLLIGPNANDIYDKEDVDTSKSGMDEVIDGARKSIPSFNLRDVITSFAGLRAKSSKGDFILGASDVESRFINVAGIESPGLTAAPAIGEYITQHIVNEIGTVEKNNTFNPIRKRIVKISELEKAEVNEMIKNNP